jgi:hypothetical protein
MFSGCSKDDDGTITVADSGALTQEVYADKTQGTSGVTFTTSDAWTSSIAEVATTKAASPAWISISPASGNAAGDYTIVITLSPNLSAVDRTATITITCNGSTITISVTQKATLENGKFPDDITFMDSRGNVVIIPYGAKSCVSKVISFTHGEPWTSQAGWQDPENIIGVPVGDVEGEVVTLGIGGEIVVEFDVYITDGEGNDIYVFEVGPDVEATKVEVSTDLKSWIYVGDADGSISGVDITGKVPAGAKYRYARITDIKGQPSTWSGADVDAVAVIHPVLE